MVSVTHKSDTTHLEARCVSKGVRQPCPSECPWEKQVNGSEKGKRENARIMRLRLCSPEAEPETWSYEGWVPRRLITGRGKQTRVSEDPSQALELGVQPCPMPWGAPECEIHHGA